MEQSLCSFGARFLLCMLISQCICCCYCCSVTKSCLTPCDPMGCSMPGSPILYYLPESARIHVLWVGDAILSTGFSRQDWRMGCHASPSGPCFVRTLRYFRSILSGPTWHGSSLHRITQGFSPQRGCDTWRDIGYSYPPNSPPPVLTSFPANSIFLCFVFSDASEYHEPGHTDISSTPENKDLSSSWQRRCVIPSSGAAALRHAITGCPTWAVGTVTGLWARGAGPTAWNWGPRKPLLLSTWPLAWPGWGGICSVWRHVKAQGKGSVSKEGIRSTLHGTRALEEQGWDNPGSWHAGEAGQQDRRCGGGPVRWWGGDGGKRTSLCTWGQALIQHFCRDFIIVLGSRYFSLG